MAWEVSELERQYTLVSKSYDFAQAITFLAEQRIGQANRQNTYYELGDCDTIPPYKQALNEIDAAIGKLKAARREMQEIAGHLHRWNDDDYCVVCGMDGRG